MSFRDLIDSLDDAVFELLGDTAFIEEREVLGMFSVPWLQPKLGKIITALREPHLVVRVSDSDGVVPGQVVRIELPEYDGGGSYTLVRVEPGGDGLVALVLRLKP